MVETFPPSRSPGPALTVSTNPPRRTTTSQGAEARDARVCEERESVRMSVEANGEVWDLGSGLKLQCGTPYALVDERTGEVLYALLGGGSKLEGLVGQVIQVVGEESDAYPEAECEILELAEVHQR